MTELARRERFLFQKDDMNFFWIENVNCMSKYVKDEEDLINDAIVMISRGLNSKNEMEQNPMLVNSYDIKSIQKLNRWVSAAISDIEKRFTDRMVYTIMDEKMFAVVLVRVGGRPLTEEDYEEMLPDDRQAVEAFEKFIDTIKFK